MVRDLVKMGTEKAEVLNTFFTFFLFSWQSADWPQKYQVPESSGKNWSKEGNLGVEEDKFTKYLNKLDI